MDQVNGSNGRLSVDGFRADPSIGLVECPSRPFFILENNMHSVRRQKGSPV